MKKSLLLLMLVASFGMILQAQKPLATFFSEDGYKFTVYLDGKQINQVPQSRVENIEMDNDWAKARIVFEDPSLPPVEKTIQGRDADNNVSAVTWVIKQTGKGKWKIAPSSWRTLDKPEESEQYQEMETPQETESTPAVRQSNTSTTTTQTTATTSSQPTGANVSMSAGGTGISMNININDNTEPSNVNMNMNVPGVDVNGTSQTSTTYTTTTVTTTTSGTENNQPVAAETQEEVNPLPGYNGSVGCSNPMSDSRFSGALQSISSKDFEDSKMTVAKQVLNSNCLFVSQVKKIMKAFDFEASKLEFAKAAYSHTYDIDNYYELNDVFDFESSIDDLNEFINK